MDIEETALLNGDVPLWQPRKGFRACVDTVLVSAFAPVEPKQKILDLGCGVGGAGLCLNKRISALDLYGIEIDKGYADLASKNYLDNDVAGEAYHRDIRNRMTEHRESFDHIICNPPYLTDGEHVRSPDISKARAMGHGDGEATLEDWVRAFRYYLKPMGCLTLIQRTDMLGHIILLLGKAFGAIEVLPIFSKESDAQAKRFVIRAVKGRKSGMQILKPFYMHELDGEFTKQADQVLRDGSALPMIFEELKFK